MDPELKRALTIGGAAIAGVLVLVGIAFAVSSGNNGDETTSVKVPDRTSTSSSSTSSTSTSTSTTTLPLPPVTVPPTAPPTSPPTVIVIPPTTPPTSPPTTPPTVAPTTSPSTTTSTTHPGGSTTTSTTRPEGEAELNTALETALNGGVAPDPGTPERVQLKFVPDDAGERVRVTWKLDDTLTTEEQRVQARLDAFTLLQVIQAANLPGDGPVVLRATLPDPDTGEPNRVIRLVYERDTLAGIDFTTIDPLTIFTLADDSEIDSSLAPTPTTTSTT